MESDDVKRDWAAFVASAPRTRDRLLLQLGFLQGIIAGSVIPTWSGSLVAGDFCGFIPADRVAIARTIVATLTRLCERDRLGRAALAVSRAKLQPGARGDLSFSKPTEYTLDLPSALGTWRQFEQQASDQGDNRFAEGAANILESWRREGEAFIEALLSEGKNDEADRGLPDRG